MRSSLGKVRVPVRVSEPGHRLRDGWLLLFEGDERSGSVVDLMNATRIVLPFIQTDEPTIMLVPRCAIEWVAVGATVATRLVHPRHRTVTHEQRVELKFADDSRIEGAIQWDGSQPHPWLRDGLDDGDEFLLLKTGFGSLVVNRQRIRDARWVDDAPHRVAVDTLRS